MYCFMMMTTTKPGSPSVFQTWGRGVFRTYEMQILEADSEQALLEKFICQAESWLMNHPDREALGIDTFEIERKFWYPRDVLFEARAETELPDIFSCDYTFTGPDGISCVISSGNCWGPDLWCLAKAINEANMFPKTPEDFDSVAIESEEALTMLRGDGSEYTNYWNRTGWKMKNNICEHPGVIEEINRELEQIARDPRLGSFLLKYFEGIH